MRLVNKVYSPVLCVCVFIVNTVSVYWLGDKKCVTDDTETKTPPPGPPTASVDDSKVKSSIEEWEDITGEAIPSVHYLMISEYISFCVEENEKLKVNVLTLTEEKAQLQEEFEFIKEKASTNGKTILH